MVLCLGSWDHARQMGSSSAASPPELQIHDSSIEVSSGKGSHLNISSRDTSTATTSNTTTTDGYPLPEEKNCIQRLRNGNGWVTSQEQMIGMVIFLWCRYLVQIRRRQAKSNVRSSAETTIQIHLFSTMPTWWWSGALTTCEGMRSRC
ncbi:hypothetical protein VPH35_041932 [Triticum aestivum]